MTGVRLTHHRVGAVTLRVARLGEGPPVVLCHGFPQLWYAWRHVMPVLAEAGYTAIAPDLRGYGGSDVPDGVAAYRQQAICADLVGLLESLGHRTATYVGHDMGGATVWHLAACAPKRVRAVCSVGTPYGMPGRAPLTELWRDRPGAFDYQLHLQLPGVAEAELEKDVTATVNLFLRAPDEGVCALDRFHDVRARGGLLAGLPPDQPRSRLLTEDDLAYYVAAFRRTGFAGALNWYRHHETTWSWLLDHARHPLRQPALLVSPGRDPVLTEDLSAGLERVVPRLRRAALPDCGHYVPEEQPDRLGRLLVDWLDELT